MILGGFLMLPATFAHDAKIRVSKDVIGIFAVVILSAGFAFTGLLTFAVRNPIFQADALFLPSLTSCAVGLLTICYDFLIDERYFWSTPALLVVIAAAISTVTYAGLLIYCHRKINIVRSRGSLMSPLHSDDPENAGREASASTAALWQDPAYYENYIRNMFPASAHPPQPPQQPTTGYDPNCITEDEMQRQQMLMLLLQSDKAPTPEASQSTFRIDWQGQEPDDLAPAHGYYAPHSASSASQSSAYPPSGISRQWTNESMPAWDGVWRDPAPIQLSIPGRGRTESGQWNARDASAERREQRRREIEMGR